MHYYFMKINKKSKNWNSDALKTQINLKNGNNIYSTLLNKFEDYNSDAPTR